ncbi:RNA-directed DNA polymerase (reverse transcriptase)-related family protein [Arabidopsis thaliana]|uniref:RNA-directed DNA polymerase (Reverse transcriptase)-related family protein n=1 Tax=Arabidopsis thaliana TaxID=3702 RepID=A0A1I9LSY4_ARATH|nr:RNA-directed DNA polymerase (reverse transcriptase)-related family protein [Arabidopsis thaliana]ANM65692.1 RNA-directed DNA polymerase (reverse transcriptase)-related family protein [Arabidopsis thaliana]|eukprot:NP_001327642.1 RNA-directed DNA polymerase (reverse transcriptase)-related family protein [Arabidopsis thaliana]
MLIYWMLITHLCFADDLLVFTDGKKSSIEGILQIFGKFADFSGLQISLEKSTIYMAGVKDNDKADILHSFPFASGALPVRYLGLPLLTKKMTTSDYGPLVEKIRVRIGKWTARHLSFAGRLQLISSVIHSLTNFWMSAFRLPSACIKEIDSICSSFLWSGPELNTKKAKVAWSDVCTPKDEGGLGIRSLKEANKVSLLKLIWRMLSSTSLWVQWLRLYLLRKGSFWSISGNTTLGSWMWKKILKHRALASGFVKHDIHNGSNTSFWFDNWSKIGRLIDVTGHRGCIDMGITLHASVAEAVVNHRPRRHRHDTLLRIEDVIAEVRHQGLTSGEDTVRWKGNGDIFKPCFNTKETWAATREPKLKVNWYKGVWFSHATPKYSVLAWIAIKNRLTTGDRMLSWNAGADSSCVLCHHLVETRDHLFFTCPYSAEVPFLTRYTFQLTLHSLWKERNGRRHGEVPQAAAQMMKYESQIMVKLSDGNLTDAYLEYLRNELQSVEAESAKVSEEIERLSQSHALDSSRLQRDLEGLLLSLDSMSSQDVEKSKENQPSSSSMEVCEVIDDDKFKMFELENQMEEKRMILKSLEDLDSLRKRFDAAEQVEDALTGLKVLEFDGNFIRLQLRTYIQKLDGFLGQHKFDHITEPSELIHELLIYLKDKTTEITKFEMFPNDIYIGDIIEAADSFRQVRLHSAVLDTRSSVQWVVAKVQDKIISTTLRKDFVMSSKTIRYTFEYYDKDETIVAHIAGGIDAFLKVSDGWPLLNTPLKLASLKNSDNQSKGFSLSLISKLEELANSLDLETRQNLSGFMDAVEKILVQQTREELKSNESSQK